MASKLENMMGLLRVRVIRGVNLAVRDVLTSDPYVVVKLAKQKLKTRVLKKNVNPEWNEDLTLSVTNPNIPVKLEVYDHDTFTRDDSMGEAEFDIRPFIGALMMRHEGLRSGTILTTVHPSSENCLAEESHVVWLNGKVVQHMFLRLQNVECGEVELELQWVDIKGSRGS